MRIRCFFPVLLLCAGWQSTTVASPIIPIPDLVHCSVTDRFVVCPAGDSRFDVVVRDQYWIPMTGTGVWLDFSGCTTLRLCPDCCTGVTIDPVARTAFAVTDASGAVTFSLKMGGVCNGSTISTYASGPGGMSPSILLARSAVSSPDQDGDLDVDASDVATVAGAIGTANWGADFNGDGLVTLSDLDWLTNNHVGHSCVGVVPARTPTWGGLKLLYR